MKEIVVISSKGGTGKTSTVASFAALAGNTVLADCYVNADKVAVSIVVEDESFR